MNKDTHFGFEKVSTEEKQEKVNSVFTSVAENYDLMNDVMSFGLHRFWKKIMIELAGVKPDSKVLDLAGGTGDIAKEIHLNFPDAEITVADINAEMLVYGKKRSVDENFFKNTSFCQLNGELLPFGDEYFDTTTIAFGLRNFTDKEKGLSEMHRCLANKGKLIILEFSKPQNAAFSKIYDWYSFNVMPVMGSIFANDSDSYRYLAESIRMHPDQERLKEKILKAGFTDCKFYNLLNGIVAIHVAEKN